MPKNSKTAAGRTSIWRANAKRCLYCDEPIAFRDLEVDHLIPDSTSPGDLSRLAHSLGLPTEFSLEDFRNLVPSHHGCNKKKWKHEFSESSLRFYLEIWERKQRLVSVELERFQREAENDKILAQLTYQVEIGRLSVPARSFPSWKDIQGPRLK